MNRPKVVLIEVDDATWELMQRMWATNPQRGKNPTWQNVFKAALSTVATIITPKE